LLGWGLTPAEVKEVTVMTDCLVALRLLEPALDANYEDVRAAAFGWKMGVVWKMGFTSSAFYHASSC
jgi:hypothetical protein